MKIVYFANNWVGWQVLKGLKDRSQEIVGLVVHPEEKRKYGDEIVREAGLPPEVVFDGSQLGRKKVQSALESLQADLGLSVFFAYVIRPPVLDMFPKGIINLHNSLLPYNRGVYSNVWSIVDGTPAGVSLHYIDDGLDTGDLIAQQEIPVEPWDTGESLYRKKEQACLELFSRTWPDILGGIAGRQPQDLSAGTFHVSKDVEAVDEIELNRHYRAGRLLNILRARTFPPYKGAYFKVGDKKVYLRLQMEVEPED
jgi:methionyl-tRNA formyltransferase